MKKIIRSENYQAYINQLVWIIAEMKKRKLSERFIMGEIGLTQGWEFRKYGKKAPFVWYPATSWHLEDLLQATNDMHQVLAVRVINDCWIGKTGEEVILTL